MTTRRHIPWTSLFAAIALAACAQLSLAQPGGPLPEIGAAGSSNEIPAQQEGVEVVERLGQQIPLDLPFLNANGDLVSLRDFFTDDRPVILAMVYYDCPVVCGIVMGKLTEAFKGIDFDIGKDYNVVFASIDPSETPTLAASVKGKYLASYARTDDANAVEGWSFLTSPADSSRTVAKALGWEYKPVTGGEFSHPVCIFVLTPEGKVARYVYGVGYEPETMRMALLEASEGKVSKSIGDKIRLFCFRYDPTTGKYALAAFRVVQLGGVLSVLTIGSLVGVMLMRERRRTRHLRDAGPSPLAAAQDSQAQTLSGSKT